MFCTDHARHVFKTAEEAQNELDFLQNKLDCCLVIDGESLQVRTFSLIITNHVLVSLTRTAAMPYLVQERVC